MSFRFRVIELATARSVKDSEGGPPVADRAGPLVPADRYSALKQAWRLGRPTVGRGTRAVDGRLAGDVVRGASGTRGTKPECPLDSDTLTLWPHDRSRIRMVDRWRRNPWELEELEPQAQTPEDPEKPTAPERAV
jgi:hypothetical protein